jgi:hypothetical protein
LEAFSFDLTSPEMILSKSNAMVALELGEDDKDIVNEVCDIYCNALTFRSIASASFQ